MNVAPNNSQRSSESSDRRIKTVADASGVLTEGLSDVAVAVLESLHHVVQSSGHRLVIEPEDSLHHARGAAFVSPCKFTSGHEQHVSRPARGRGGCTASRRDRDSRLDHRETTASCRACCNVEISARVDSVPWLRLGPSGQARRSHRQSRDRTSHCVRRCHRGTSRRRARRCSPQIGRVRDLEGPSACVRERSGLDRLLIEARRDVASVRHRRLERPKGDHRSSGEPEATRAGATRRRPCSARSKAAPIAIKASGSTAFA